MGGGFTKENIEKVFAIKARRGRMKEYKSDTSKFVEKSQPWKHVQKVDVALPCATQNSMRVEWTREEVDQKLQDIMKHIYTTIRDMASDLGAKGDFQPGANAAGFKKVADAMLAQGMAL